MFSSVFVDRPRLAIVIAIVTVIAGAIALVAIPLAQYPDIVPPQVSVTTTYPGASAAVVEATVAQPLEAQLVGVDRAIYMRSVSGNDGSYSLKVSFELGTDPDINTVNVNNRVQAALARLPAEVKQQGVTVQKQSTALLGVLSVFSPKGTKDPLFISNYVTINVLDRIKSTPGVGSATLFGPQDYSMRVWIQTDRLTGLGLTSGDVIAAIQAQNIQAAVGRIGARPISNDQQLQLNIQTKGRLASPEEFARIVIRTNPDGSILRLGDVARIELGAATPGNGKPEHPTDEQGPATALDESPVHSQRATWPGPRNRHALLHDVLRMESHPTKTRRYTGAAVQRRALGANDTYGTNNQQLAGEARHGHFTCCSIELAGQLLHEIDAALPHRNSNSPGRCLPPERDSG